VGEGVEVVVQDNVELDVSRNEDQNLGRFGV
jgi:hypothetical protein